MAEKDYQHIDDPYDNFLERKVTEFGVLGNSAVGSDSGGGSSGQAGGAIVENPSDIDGSSVEGQSFDNLFIASWIKSRNWQPKARGFYIDGRTGYAEFSSVFITGAITATSGTIGGFEIGADYIRDLANSMGLASTVTGGDDVRFWAGATFANRATAVFRVTEGGVLTVSKALISGGSDVSFISDTLNTSAKSILKDFVFSPLDYSGAFKSGDITWNTTTGAITGGSGVVLYKNGIVGAAGGVATFTIDATTGNATFAGTLVAAAGSLGTITSGSIYSGLFSTAASGSTSTRITMSSADNTLRFFNSNNSQILALGGISGNTGLEITPTNNNARGILVANASGLVLTTRLVEVNVVNSSSSASAGYFSNAGSGYALEGANSGTGGGLRIDKSGTAAIAADIAQGTTGIALNIEKSGVTSGIVTKITNSGTDNSLFIDHNNSTNAGVIELDVDAADGNNTVGIKMNIANTGAGVEYAFHFEGSEVDNTKTGVSGLTGVVKVITADGLVYLPLYDTAT